MVDPITTPIQEGLNTTALNDATQQINQEIIKPCLNCIGGLTLDITVFIFGTILLLIMISFIFMYVFGNPLFIAKNAITGGTIIQHTNTPKSAALKIATVSGDGFRYKNVRDGTVAASPNAVYTCGRNIVLTYASLGVTIPTNILAAISQLIQKKITNITELKTKYEDIITLEDGTTQTVRKNDVIIKGYTFDDFRELQNEIKEEKLLPLTIEAFPNFIGRTLNSDYTEKSIKLRERLYKIDNKPESFMDVMKWILPVIIILFLGFVLVK